MDLCATSIVAERSGSYYAYYVSVVRPEIANSPEDLNVKSNPAERR